MHLTLDICEFPSMDPTNCRLKIFFKNHVYTNRLFPLLLFLKQYSIIAVT